MCVSFRFYIKFDAKNWTDQFLFRFKSNSRKYLNVQLTTILLHHQKYQSFVNRTKTSSLNQWKVTQIFTSVGTEKQVLHQGVQKLPRVTASRSMTSLLHMKITASARIKIVAHAVYTLSVYLPIIFSYTHTLLFCWEIRVVVIAVFLSKLVHRPLFNDMYCVEDWFQYD